MCVQIVCWLNENNCLARNGVNALDAMFPTLTDCGRTLFRVARWRISAVMRPIPGDPGRMRARLVAGIKMSDVLHERRLHSLWRPSPAHFLANKSQPSFVNQVERRFHSSPETLEPG